MPFTLLRNGKPQPSGAVGLAMRSRQNFGHLEFNGMEPLSRPVAVLRSEGNIIHELVGGLLPARVIAEALQSRGGDKSSQKELDFYVGVRDSSDTTPEHMDKMYRILAGAPSRGSVAIENVLAPRQGSVIQLFCRPHTIVSLPENISFAKVSLSDGPLTRMEPQNAELIVQTITTGPEEWTSSGTKEIGSPENDDCVLCAPGIFVFPSEHGLLSSAPVHLDDGTAGKPTGSADPWKCTVPGTVGRFCYS